MKSASCGGRLHLLDGGGDLRGDVRHQPDRLARALLQLVHAGGDLGGIDLGLAHLLDLGHEVGVIGQEVEDAEAPDAAGHDMVAAVGRGDVAEDLGHGADFMQMLRPRRLDGRIGLQQDADGLVGAGRGLRAGDGLGTAKAERRHDARKQHGVAQGQHDQRAFRHGRVRDRLVPGRAAGPAAN